MSQIENEINKIKKRLSALEGKDEKRTSPDIDKVAIQLLKKLEAYSLHKT